MRYAIPPHLAHVSVIPPEDDPESRLRVYLRKLPEGPTLMLEGVGALIWSLASDGTEDIAAAVACEVGESIPQIRAEVESYLKLLALRGLLRLPEQRIVR